MKNRKNNHPVMIKVSKEVLNSFDEVIKSCRTTRSEFLRQVLEAFLATYKPNIGVEESPFNTLSSSGEPNSKNQLTRQ